MKKTIFLFLVVFLGLQTYVFAQWNVEIQNVETGKAAEAGLNDIIKLDLTPKPPITVLPDQPYYLVLNGNVLEKITAFKVDATNTAAFTIYFHLNETEISKVIKEDKSYHLKLDVADKNKNNFTKVAKENMTLMFSKKELILKEKTFRLDRQLELTIVGYNRIQNFPEDISKIGLYFNKILVTHAKVVGSCLKQDSLALTFALDSAGMTKVFYRNNSEEKVALGVGTKEKCLIDTGDNKVLTIMFMRPNGKLFFWSISVFFAFFLLWLCRKTNLIKDSFTVGEENYRPYSLSRTQFAIWTFVIIISLLYIWFTTKEMASLPSSTFILLGISALVKLTSWYIEGLTAPSENSTRKASVVSSGRSKEGKVPQFLRDLISDTEGVSIHRLQNLLFTVFLAIFFWWEVMNHLELPVISTNMLALLGVSGAAYTFNKKEETGGKPTVS